MRPSEVAAKVASPDPARSRSAALCEARRPEVRMRVTRCERVHSAGCALWVGSIGFGPRTAASQRQTT
jgi:hypothetical protein